MVLYLRISASGAKVRCGRRAARKTFISRREKRQPIHACGPSVKDMTFAKPGFREALEGNENHRSGLELCWITLFCSAKDVRDGLT